RFEDPQGLPPVIEVQTLNGSYSSHNIEEKWIPQNPAGLMAYNSPHLPTLETVPPLSEAFELADAAAKKLNVSA
ncbi:MAG: hypothetical protein ACKO34_07090, partial [Vampirovibrionales bacterium]